MSVVSEPPMSADELLEQDVADDGEVDAAYALQADFRGPPPGYNAKLEQAEAAARFLDWAFHGQGYLVEVVPGVKTHRVVLTEHPEVPSNGHVPRRIDIVIDDKGYRVMGLRGTAKQAILGQMELALGHPLSF